MYSSTYVFSSLALLGFAAATTHRIEVGHGGLMFNPNMTKASAGDVLEFVYYPKNHSVVQSSFSDPCESTSGFFSGYMAVPSGEGNMTFQVTVNDTKPIWFYCSQNSGGSHCAKGLVGCVNCPTSGNTLAAYAAAAMNTTGMNAEHPAEVEGGVFAMNMNTSSTSTTSSSSSTKTGSSSTSMSMGTETTSTSTSSASATHTGTSDAMALGTAKFNLMTVAVGLCGLGFYLM